MEKLTDREIDIMMTVWNSPNEAVPTREILKQVVQPSQHPLQTLQVALRRLCEKEMLECEKTPQTNRYRALVTREDYLAFAVENFLTYHFHGSAKQMIIFLLQTGKISRQEVLDIMERWQGQQDKEESAG